MWKRFIFGFILNVKHLPNFHFPSNLRQFKWPNQFIKGKNPTVKDESINICFILSKLFVILCEKLGFRMRNWNWIKDVSMKIMMFITRLRSHEKQIGRKHALKFNFSQRVYTCCLAKLNLLTQALEALC